MNGMRRDTQSTGNGTFSRRMETDRAIRRRMALGGFLALLIVLSGCTGGGGTAAGLTSGQFSLGLEIDPFPDGTADITVSIVDAVSLVPLYSETYLSQATPFSVDYPLSSPSILVTVTILLHQDPAAAIYSGTNAGSLGTLTDLGVDFTTFMLPMFVVSYSTIPPTLTDVQTITDANNLALSSAFPSGPYSLFWSRPVCARIIYKGLGTSVLPLAMWDDTHGTYSVSTRY
jgi:hypothetical protein